MTATKRIYLATHGEATILAYDIEHRIGQIETLADMRGEIAVQLKRAAVLAEIGALDEQALEALRRRIEVYRNACELLAKEIAS